jgi:hypothetical protein
MWWREFRTAALDTIGWAVDPIGSTVQMVIDHHMQSQKPRIYLASDNGTQTQIRRR